MGRSSTARARYIGVLCEVYTPSDFQAFETLCATSGWKLDRFTGCRTVRVLAHTLDQDIQGLVDTFSTHLASDAHALLEVVAVQLGSEPISYTTGERITVVRT